MVRADDVLQVRFYRDGGMRDVEAAVRSIQPLPSPSAASCRSSGARFEATGRSSPAHGRVEGVMIADVERGSPAWRHGVRKGAVVVGVNHRKVQSLDGLRAALEEPGRATVLHLLRGRTQMVVVIQ